MYLCARDRDQSATQPYLRVRTRLQVESDGAESRKLCDRARMIHIDGVY